MNNFHVEEVLRKIPNLNETAESVSRSIHDGVLQGGRAVRQGVDLLHGTWLGHPLHPVLTDVTIGALSFGTLLDLLSLNGGGRRMEKAADTLIEIGTASAIPTALAGIADYTTIPRRVVSTGATHGLANTLALVLYLLSVRSRRSGNRPGGVLFAALGLFIMLISAWLGGEMSFRYGVGVNKTVWPKGPKNWTTVLGEDKLMAQQPVRVEVEGNPVLLYRQGDRIYAIGAVCPHEGGPLDEGEFDGHCVVCPWHHSVFNLEDGTVVHGPSTYAVPSYDVRVLNGQIELRLREEKALVP